MDGVILTARAEGGQAFKERFATMVAAAEANFGPVDILACIAAGR